MATGFVCDRCNEPFRYWARPWEHFKFNWDMKIVARQAGGTDPDICPGCYLVLLERMVTGMKELLASAKRMEEK